MKKKIVLSLALLGQCAYGLGFGSMGNTSAGLGDSGVALKKSAWGVYYNPALLAADNRGKFGYSFGASLDQKGLGGLIETFLNADENLNAQLIYDKYKTSPKHTLNVSSQNGLVMQITGGTYQVPKLDENGEPTEEMIEKRNPYGAFTMAVFLSAFGYGEVNASFKKAEVPDGPQGDQIIADANLDGVALLEVPVAWGWRFETSGGDISIGAAVKYMGAMGVGARANGIYDDLQGANFETQTLLPERFALAHNFGIDLGILYSISGASIGLVAKNINVPSFDIGGKKLTIKPQVRLGLAYDFAKYFALTFDADLMANETLFQGSPKTQMIGGGFLMDFKYIDLRFGAMGDVANNFRQGAILTGGINLLGFLDVAVQASTRMFKFDQYKIPNALSVKVGGSFTF